LEQITRIVGGTTCRGLNRSPESELRNIKPIDKGIDHPHRSICRNVILDPGWQQRRLTPISP
ncbi:hypothetical protein, partial [Rhizobium sp. BR 315]|uniref:hypothetical protein n=1 Tax=Rhizobium sp. BR 315 TaxID=3040014 RepID=UPI003D34920E